MPKTFFYVLLGHFCETCGKPAIYVIKSGGETYNYACNETHARAQTAELTEAWSRDA